MTILIAGGGIGGLTLALSLHQVGIPCRVFESVPELKPLGVGINVLPHAVRELTELGLLDKLDAAGVRTKELAYFSKHGQADLERAARPGCRLQLAAILDPSRRAAADPARRRHRAPRPRRMLNGHQRGKLRLDVADGVAARFIDKATGGAGTYEGSLLIAADGIHSAVRAKLYPDEGPPIWNGRILWRGVTESERPSSPAAP
jgi:2-polyprenyl-6-methoxyphenol hydroxylase-like FAD-dependent oxidoreductase